jgi:hypothetical protein
MGETTNYNKRVSNLEFALRWSAAALEEIFMVWLLYKAEIILCYCRAVLLPLGDHSVLL